MIGVMSWQAWEDETHFGDIGILESSLGSDSVPVNIGLVASMLDDAEEQHSLSGSGLSLVVSHSSDVLQNVSLRVDDSEGSIECYYICLVK